MAERREDLLRQLRVLKDDLHQLARRGRAGCPTT